MSFWELLESVIIPALDKSKPRWITVQNLLEKPIEFQIFYQFDSEQGTTGGSGPNLGPKQKYNIMEVDYLRGKRVDFWIEVKVK